MPALPADTLRNRTFVALLVAQFLAAFNDQAIHASAMFFAINRKTLTEANAISSCRSSSTLRGRMFGTLAGYFADRYQQAALARLLEIRRDRHHGGRLARLLAGPARLGRRSRGSCCPRVFLMGTHCAFFVPAKYGAMPEILQPHTALARQRHPGIAVVPGRHSGHGLRRHLSTDIFEDAGHQYYIGAHPRRPRRHWRDRKLVHSPHAGGQPAAAVSAVHLSARSWQSIRTLFRSRPLALAMVGIAFFTFMVAFMRSTVYMLRRIASRPRWSESYTSIVVGTVALGIGLGSPLAGFLSRPARSRWA